MITNISNESAWRLIYAAHQRDYQAIKAESKRIMDRLEQIENELKALQESKTTPDICDCETCPYYVDDGYWPELCKHLIADGTEYGYCGR